MILEFLCLIYPLLFYTAGNTLKSHNVYLHTHATTRGTRVLHSIQIILQNNDDLLKS